MATRRACCAPRARGWLRTRAQQRKRYGALSSPWGLTHCQAKRRFRPSRWPRSRRRRPLQRWRLLARWLGRLRRGMTPPRWLPRRFHRRCACVARWRRRASATACACAPREAAGRSARALLAMDLRRLPCGALLLRGAPARALAGAQARMQAAGRVCSSAGRQGASRDQRVISHITARHKLAQESSAESAVCSAGRRRTGELLSWQSMSWRRPLCVALRTRSTAARRCWRVPGALRAAASRAQPPIRVCCE